MTPVHGQESGLRWHTSTRQPNCAPCRALVAAKKAAYRKARILRRGAPPLVDACGVHRRLRALARIGWSFGAIAARAGVDRSAVQHWLLAARSHVDTVAVVTRIYNELADTTGPSAQARRHAERHGWPPPIAWDDDTIHDPAVAPYAGQAAPIDEVAVHRAMTGRPVALSRAETNEAIRLLTARGRSSNEIAELLGTNQRRVVRRRAATTRRTA